MINHSYSFGKPLVVDMMAIDMLESVRMKFDVVQEGLLNAILTKEILKDDKFLSLVKPEDGEQYSKTAFLGARIENFKFIILTQLWNPSEDLISQTHPLRVINTFKKFLSFEPYRLHNGLIMIYIFYKYSALL
jgi:hypothetical protein